MPGSKTALDPQGLEETGRCKWRLFVSHGFRPDGKANRVTKTIGPCSEREADRKLHELYQSFIKKPPANANRITFTKFAEIWEERHCSVLSPNTRIGYVSAIKARLKPEFGHLYLNKITTDAVIDYLNGLKRYGSRLDGRSGNISPGTIHQLYRTLKTMFNCAVQWGYLPVSPIDGIPKNLKPRPHYRKKAILGPEHLRVLLQELETLKPTYTNLKNRLFFHLALVTGCRAGEIIPLTWRDIDLDTRMIEISKDIYVENRKTLVQQQTKGGGNRYVYCDDEAVGLLRQFRPVQEAWLAKHNLENPGGYIFIKRVPKAGGKQEAELPDRQSFYRFIRRLLERLGLPHMDVHGFRRTAASYSLDSQVPLTDIQTMLGHKSLTTTIVYLRRLNTGVRKSADALSSAYRHLAGKAETAPGGEGSEDKKNP